ncbi:MAG: PKD domain-containing protein, partial [Sphingobacteriaceae bacterium]
NFTIQGQNTAVTICGPQTITPVNTSTVDQSCQAVTALWTVTGGPAGGFSIAGPVNSLTTPPQITFNLAGVYRVRLALTSGTCTSVPHDVEVTVNTQPIAELPADISICGGASGQIVYSGNAANTFYARLEGTAVPDATTYSWDILDITGNITATISDPAAKYPTISYSGIGSFRVRVRHSNSCAPNIEDSQIITVENSPQVTPGTYTAVCPGDDIPLNLTTITGNYQSLEWTGGTGTFSPNRNVLNPVYTPSPAEIQAGGVTLNLVVNTGLSGTCSTITTPVPLTIRPQNIITSASAKTICTGSNVDYDIIAQSGSTFTWTVVSSTNVTGAQDGSGIAIDDLLANTSPNNSDGEVVYRITPFNSGCQGVSFTFTVTVVANVPPTFTFPAPNFRCGTQNITFTNTTTSQSGEYRWDWNDGSPLETNNDPTVTHNFPANADGTDHLYRIRLIHVSACGNISSVIQEITVRPEFPVARIGTPTRTSECGQFTLTVPNTSPGSNDKYEFRIEDENGNLVPNSIVISGNTVTKTIAGDKSAAEFTIVPVGNATYYVRMVANNDCNSADIPNRWPIPVSTAGRSEMFLSVSEACQSTPVSFNNNSIGTSFTYIVYRENSSEFDRFNVTETQRSYTYTGFTEPGIFDVTVTAQSAGCGNAGESIKHRINIVAVPALSFTANTVGCDNLVYQFTPTQVNSSTYNYLWNFGDGTGNIPGPNPAPHTYAAPGTYTVTLTVTNSLGCNVPVDPVLVVARPRLIADFTVLPGEEIFIPNYHFSFRDNSEGVPASWLWDFGNGESSNLPNPEYTYPATDIGSHLVTLTVTNIASDGSTCTSVKQKSVTISGTPGTLFIPNAFIPSSSSAAIQTFMAKGSGIESWHMQIFNKWGQLVWETNKLGADGEPLEGWDGTYKGSPAPQGAYVWQVSAKFINGTEWKGMSYRNSPPKRSGVINLIR